MTERERRPTSPRRSTPSSGTCSAKPRADPGPGRERAGVPLEVAQELWRLLGFAHQPDDAVAFTQADVQALEYTHDLVKLGILSPDRQAALVRTWGRSFARLAEWQTRLLTDVALESPDPVRQVTELASAVLPRVESLQAYVWRRHLAGAGVPADGQRPAGSDTSGWRCASSTSSASPRAARSSTEAELVRVDRVLRGRVLRARRRPRRPGHQEHRRRGPLRHRGLARGRRGGAASMTARGTDADDEFPEVRAASRTATWSRRLGDVFGPTVNIASRLTSVARPGSVLVDQGAHDALTGDTADRRRRDRATHGARARRLLRFRRMRATSVKGYSRLQSPGSLTADRPEPYGGPRRRSWRHDDANSRDELFVRSRAASVGIVTWRFARPERAARWSASGRSRRPAPRRGRRRTRSAGSSSASGPVPTGRSQTGASRPCARNIPTRRATRRRGRPCRRRAAGPARRAARPRARASPSAGAPWCRRRSSTPPRPGSAGRSGWPRRWPARARPPASSLSVDVGDPEVEAVVHA